MLRGLANRPFAPPSRQIALAAWTAAALGAAGAAVFAVTWLRDFEGALQRSNFYSFYAAARIFWERGPGAVYTIAAQREYQGAVTASWPAHATFLPYIHPPYFTILLAPLGLLPQPAAYAVQAALGALLAVAALAVLTRAAGLRRGAAATAMLLGLAFVPLQLALFLGQSDVLILLALGGACVFWVRGREGLAGALVGLAMIKPTLLVLLPLFFVVRRAWRALGAFAAVAAVLSALSLAVFGAGGVAGYLGAVLPWTAGRDHGWGITAQTASSLRGLLELAPGGRPVAIAILLAAVVIAALALSWRPHRPRLDFAVAIAVSLALSLYENLHDQTLLLAPAILLAGLLLDREVRWPGLGWGVLAASYLLIEASLFGHTGLAGAGGVLLAAYLAAERLAVEPDPLPLGELERRTERARRVVVLPAYHAEGTLRQVVAEIPHDQVDRILLVDDASTDRTAELALELGIDVIKHARNLGYGGNQKTCYANALLMGAEVVVMLHPDAQYDPALIPVMCQAIEEGRGDLVLGSRWLGLDPAAAGMPWWKRIGNRFLTATENRVLGLHLSEYHTGYRAYSRRFLETLPFAVNSDDFVFDSQVLIQAGAFRFRIVEIPAVGRYFEGMSSIGLRRSVVYGLKTLAALLRYLLHRAGLTAAWLVPRKMAAATERATATAPVIT